MNHLLIEKNFLIIIVVNVFNIEVIHFTTWFVIKGREVKTKTKEKKKQYIVIAEKWKVFYSSAGVMLVFSALF